MSTPDDGSAAAAVELRPMSPEGYLAWVPKSIVGFADQQVRAGAMPRPEARQRAEREFDALLPQGLHTPGHHLWFGYDGDREVGFLWLRVGEGPEGAEAYVVDVGVRPEARRRGYGRALMLAAEEEALRRGATAVRLNVFGDNTAARRLYEALGYRGATTQMARRLDGGRREAPGEAAPGEAAPREAAPGEAAPGDAAHRDAVPGVRLRPMTTERFAEYLPGAGDRAHLLARGPQTPGHRLWTVHARAAGAGPEEGPETGTVWLQLLERSDGRHAFGHDLSVREEWRGRGYGRATVREVEAWCRAQGVVGLGVEVRAPDESAVRLCAQLGYAAAATTMVKSLTRPADEMRSGAGRP